MQLLEEADIPDPSSGIVWQCTTATHCMYIAHSLTSHSLSSP